MECLAIDLMSIKEPHFVKELEELNYFDSQPKGLIGTLIRDNNACFEGVEYMINEEICPFVSIDLAKRIREIPIDVYILK